MSGHTDYTWWVHSEAGYLIYKGSKKKIKTTFFTANGGAHNSDAFVIHLKNGKNIEGFSDKNVDWDDLRDRYDNSTPARKAAAKERKKKNPTAKVVVVKSKRKASVHRSKIKKAVKAGRKRVIEKRKKKNRK